MLPAHLSGGGIYLISVDVLNGTEGVEMRFSYDPIGTEASAQLGSRGPPADSVRLVRNAQDARFAYYGRKSGADVTRWHTSWEDPQALPRLVRLRLVFADTQVPWPDMVFPIRVEPGVGTAHLTLRDASGQEALPGDEELTEAPIEGESEDEPAPEE